MCWPRWMRMTPSTRLHRHHLPHLQIRDFKLHLMTSIITFTESWSERKSQQKPAVTLGPLKFFCFVCQKNNWQRLTGRILSKIWDRKYTLSDDLSFADEPQWSKFWGLGVTFVYFIKNHDTGSFYGSFTKLALSYIKYISTAHWFRRSSPDLLETRFIHIVLISWAYVMFKFSWTIVK